jgi:hypothetical protein
MTILDEIINRYSQRMREQPALPERTVPANRIDVPTEDDRIRNQDLTWHDMVNGTLNGIHNKMNAPEPAPIPAAKDPINLPFGLYIPTKTGNITDVSPYFDNMDSFNEYFTNLVEQKGSLSQEMINNAVTNGDWNFLNSSPSTPDVHRQVGMNEFRSGMTPRGPAPAAPTGSATVPAFTPTPAPAPSTGYQPRLVDAVKQRTINRGRPRVGTVSFGGGRNAY